MMYNAHSSLMIIVDVSDNPYDEETGERWRWEEGWRTARKHDYDESEG
jgi:hypothetical protein